MEDAIIFTVIAYIAAAINNRPLLDVSKKKKKKELQWYQETAGLQFRVFSLSVSPPDLRSFSLMSSSALILRWFSSRTRSSWKLFADPWE